MPHVVFVSQAVPVWLEVAWLVSVVVLNHFTPEH